jgi:hypothetical protein
LKREHNNEKAAQYRKIIYLIWCNVIPTAGDILTGEKLFSVKYDRGAFTSNILLIAIQRARKFAHPISQKVKNRFV